MKVSRFFLSANIVFIMVLITHYISQLLFMTYCKRNLFVYFFMKDCTMCRILTNVLNVTEDCGLRYLEKVFSIVVI
jgi:hypothetical protein